MGQIDRAARVGLAWPDGPFALMQKVGLERARELASAVTEFPESGFFTYGEIPVRLSELVSEDVSLVSLEVDEATGIGRIKIERPAKLNVLDPQVIADLARRFDEAENDPRVKMIVFEGIGGNLAGADIKFFTDNLKKGAAGLAEIMRFVANGLALYSKIEQSKKRTVAVLDGGTFGGGFELALAANEIIVTPQAKLALPEIGLGIIPGLRGADQLATRVAEGMAFYLMATGDPKDHTISGEEAVSMQAADYLVERGDIDRALAALARGENSSIALGKLGRMSQRQMKISTLFDRPEVRKALLEGVENPEDLDGLELEIYRETLAIARTRPRAALQLAERLMFVTTNEDTLEAVRQIFLTPMALQGLSTMGRGIQVTNRSLDDWRVLLLQVFDQSVEVVSADGPVLNLKFKEPLDDISGADSFAIVIKNRVNGRDSDGEVNDLAEIRIAFMVKGSDEVRGRVVMRTGPGEKFEVGISGHSQGSCRPPTNWCSLDVWSPLPDAGGCTAVRSAISGAGE